MNKNVFNGFPARAEVTPLPNILFSELLPAFENLSEIKVIMQVFFLLSRRKGYPRFTSLRELSNDPVILKGLYKAGDETEVELKRALELAVEHGILLHVAVTRSGHADDLYFINNQGEKDVIERIIDGTLKIPDTLIRKEVRPIIEQVPDIYNLYEQNIGLLTPIMAEELQEAEHKYPAEWIQEAFREALRANVRNWKYVHSILKRWEREGKKDGRDIRDSRKERDPDKFVKGKYGHVVRR